MVERSRRDILRIGCAAIAGCGLSKSTVFGTESTPNAADRGTEKPFRFCLNTSTIRGYKLSLPEEIDIATQAGYDGIEPWTREIEQYLESGGKLSDLRKRLDDGGLRVESAIGFPSWMVDDEEKRRAGFERMKLEMDWIAQLGGSRIAAPPAGAYGPPILNLDAVAERYRRLLEMGRQMGVTPQLEIWGGSANLAKLSQAAYVIVESGDPDACGLFDVFHIYRGGSSFRGLEHFSGDSMHVFHVNDYPADPPRANIQDSQRVFPGDGIAPLGEIFDILRRIGFHGALSLELFNPAYWNDDAAKTARTGLEKMRRAAETSPTT
ncbi:sugar phosphate isomerase/epimerase family protein [Thermopirellula anaerolimosa]